MERLTQGFWTSEIKRATSFEESWRENAKKLSLKYASLSEDGGANNISYNIFYSNTEVLRGAIKIDDPKPSIRRRASSLDSENNKKDNLIKTAADVLQKTASYYIDKNKIAEKFDLVNLDALITGRGVPWLEYEAEVDLDDEMNPVEVASQDFRIVYVNWEDYIVSPCRSDQEQGWEARRLLLTKEEAEKQFPKFAKKLKFNFSYMSKEKGEESDEKGGDKLAKVYEIWDKETKTRIYYSQGTGKLLEVQKDPYKLEEFFPAEALRFIKSSNTNVPSPEYYQYQIKAGELETISQRRIKLAQSAKANGFVAGKIADKMKNLAGLEDAQFASVDGMMSKSGGFDALIWERNLTQIQNLLAGLTDYEQTIINQIYNITGISDIMRGQGDARSTATAEALKGKYGSLRLVRRQEEIQLTIRNCYQKLSELICDNATVETLREVSGVSIPDNMQKIELMMAMKVKQVQTGEDMSEKIQQLEMMPTWEEVVEFLRDDKMRCYTLSIESNITAFDDIEQQNASIDALFTSMTAMISQAMPVVMNTPELLEPYKEMVLAKVRVSRGGLALEGAVEKAFNDIKERVEEMQKQPPQPPQPDPDKVMELQAKQQTEQMKLQQKTMSDMQKNELDAQKQQQDMVKHQQDIAIKSRDLDIKEQNNIADQRIDMMELQGEFQLAREKMAAGITTGTNIGTEN